MPATRGVAVVEDPRYRQHRGPGGHPERPERLDAVGDAVAARRDALEFVPARPARDDEILRVHDAALLAGLEAAAARAPVHLDADTYMGPGSLEIARLAAGGLVDLCLRVARGESRAGFAAVRPPGHHAERGRAMGFCLLNNVAIAARALQREAGLERVLIYDWDVHHGNGTQHSFEDDPSVLYASTHQFPYYPGTGDFDEAGTGRGSGYTLNLPLPAGCGDDEHVGVVQRVLVPVARAYRPQLILVSSGFDAHRDDPLASMQVTAQGFRHLATLVRALADEFCGGRVVFALEGGYALTGLREGTDAVLDVLLARETPSLPETVPCPPGSVLRHVVACAAEVHAGRHRDLGAA
ncbi:MAG TPA: histone deacetylase [Myxococcota bacterium]|nr:histone deacetylase [Myxococcota bacterium]